MANAPTPPPSSSSAIDDLKNVIAQAKAAAQGTSAGQITPTGSKVDKIVGGLPNDMGITVGAPFGPGIPAAPGASRDPSGRNVRTITPGTDPDSFYTTDDVWEPAGYNPGSIAKLQDGLYAAGLLSKGDYDLEHGAWGKFSRSAYADFLSQLNATGGKAAGVSKNDALNSLIQSVQAAGGGPAGAAKAARAPLVISLTSDEDIKAHGQAVAMAALGHSLTKAQEAKLVSYFQSQETQAQTRAYDLGGRTGPGGDTVKAPPDSRLDAAQVLKEQNPTEAAAQGYGNTLESFSNIMSRHFGFTGAGTPAGQQGGPVNG